AASAGRFVHRQIVLAAHAEVQTRLTRLPAQHTARGPQPMPQLPSPSVYLRSPHPLTAPDRPQILPGIMTDPAGTHSRVKSRMCLEMTAIDAASLSPVALDRLGEVRT